MYIFGSTTNTAYRTKLFDHWPTVSTTKNFELSKFSKSFQYLEDFNECKTIMGYRYPETLVEEFLTQNIPKDAKILDMACGPGNVAFILNNINVYAIFRDDFQNIILLLTKLSSSLAEPE